VGICPLSPCQASRGHSINFTSVDIIKCYSPRRHGDTEKNRS
jgi:hypothetical protein